MAASSPTGDFYCPSCECAFAVAGACPNDGSKLIRIGVMIDPFLGRDLDGKYTILEKLGQGGMGAVYRAEQRGLGREVAIKVVHALQISEPDLLKRFLREAKLASRLGHPHAVGVIDFGQTDDAVCYIAMELVTGRTLGEVFAAEGAFPPERLVRIAVQICDALECAHNLQIVHRDLKPANAMLLDGGRDFVKILDFGLAKSVAADDASVTYAGAPLGTPAYMSPELAHSRPCDGRADLYSLGVMLYQLGSGRLPFRSSSPHELIAMHAGEPAPPMMGVPEPLAAVVDRLLRKDPDERYPTAAAVRAALEQALIESDLAPAPRGSRPSTDLARPAERALAAGTESARGSGAASLETGPTRAPTPMPEVAPGLRRRWIAQLVLGAIVIAAGAGAAGYFLRASDEPAAASTPASPRRSDEVARPRPANEAAPASLDPNPALDPAPSLDPSPAPNLDANPAPNLDANLSAPAPPRPTAAPTAEQPAPRDLTGLAAASPRAPSRPAARPARRPKAQRATTPAPAPSLAAPPGSARRPIVKPPR